MTLRLAASSGGWLCSVILLVACSILWGKWDHAVMQARVDREMAGRAVAESQTANEARKNEAGDAFAQRTVALQPIILGSNQKVDAYAQTPAGRAPCLAVDRVQSVLADRNALFAFTPASSAGSVPAGDDPDIGAEQR